jgi:CDP-diacylglycerol---serine O-phosphatidyltransferase
MNEGQRQLGYWRFVLPPLLLFLSFMMFSKVRYPSFKSLNWRTQRTIPWFLGVILLLVFSVMNYEWMPALIFVLFLVYGFVRPYISKSWRREIEVEPEVNPSTPGPETRRDGENSSGD